MAFRLLTLLWLTPSFGAPPDGKPAGFDPTDRYQERKIEGWTVLVNGGFLRDQPELAAERAGAFAESALSGRA